MTESSEETSGLDILLLWIPREVPGNASQRLKTYLGLLHQQDVHTTASLSTSVVKPPVPILLRKEEKFVLLYTQQARVKCFFWIILAVN